MNLVLKFVSLVLLLQCLNAHGQIIVPNKAVTINFPKTQAQFGIRNKGMSPVVIQLDLANRNDVYSKSNDGLVVLYPKVVRLEPGATQKISATWRGKQNASHYYLVRVNSVSESNLSLDRGNKNADDAVKINVGQAFPLNIIAPEARALLKVAVSDNEVWLENVGNGGDFLDSLRLANGDIASVGRLMVPGQKMLLDGMSSDEKLVAVKFRRAGWIELGEN